MRHSFRKLFASPKAFVVAIAWIFLISLGLVVGRPDGESRPATRAEKDFYRSSMTGNTGYGIQIIEKQAMQQDIVVDAAQLQQGLADAGHIAVYNILFDTGKSEVKPESDAAIKEIAKLMTQNTALKLHVVGHRDNVGDLAFNMKLSQARASVVVAVLSTKHGVAANRLNAYCAGTYAPVASNKTDEGKAKNRRVELVEQ